MLAARAHLLGRLSHRAGGLLPSRLPAAAQLHAASGMATASTPGPSPSSSMDLLMLLHKLKVRAGTGACRRAQLMSTRSVL